MEGTSLARAVIINLEKSSSEPVKVMFNPKDYSFTKSNDWKESKTPAGNVPQFEFGGGKPTSLQMQLFFDTFAERMDVREAFTNAIWELMLVDPNLADPKTGKGRPPKVRFLWGKSWSFDAVITNIKQQYTLFLDDGTPVRATLDVTFTEVKDAKLIEAQNPTSGGVGGERVWRVQPGETLSLIAYRAYGSVGRWRVIAEANGLNQVRDLEPGMLLEIPNV